MSFSDIYVNRKTTCGKVICASDYEWSKSIIVRLGIFKFFQIKQNLNSL